MIACIATSNHHTRTHSLTSIRGLPSEAGQTATATLYQRLRQVICIYLLQDEGQIISHKKRTNSPPKCLSIQIKNMLSLIGLRLIVYNQRKNPLQNNKQAHTARLPVCKSRQLSYIKTKQSLQTVSLNQPILKEDNKQAHPARLSVCKSRRLSYMETKQSLQTVSLNQPVLKENHSAAMPRNCRHC